MLIRCLKPSDRAEWQRMRCALWPDGEDDHELEISDYFHQNERKAAVFVVEREGGALGGFLETSIRYYADGSETRNVGYIEGWYVDPDLRLQSVGRSLVAAAEQWAREQGCREMASDCELSNEISLQAHLAIGYEEVERAIHFRKLLEGETIWTKS